MLPTMHLRFVLRQITDTHDAAGNRLPEDVVRVYPVRVLQQHWVSVTDQSHEWRDVPLEKEA